MQVAKVKKKREVFCLWFSFNQAQVAPWGWREKQKHQKGWLRVKKLKPVWLSSRSLCLVAAEGRQLGAKWQRKRAHSLPEKPETSLNWYSGAKQLPRDAWPQTNAGKTSLTSRECGESIPKATEDRISRFFSTDTVWNRSVNTVKPTWLCPGNI